MLADELVVLGADSPLWSTVRPLFEAVTKLEHNDDSDTWHGWTKGQITAFLRDLPPHCALLVGVWDNREESVARYGYERLMLGCVCEVKNGEICALRTFDQFGEQTLPDLETLEPGYAHALELMRVTRAEVAPVAWALFTDKSTWDEWVYSGDEHVVDKGEALAKLAREGRCVLMGSQTAHQ